MCCDDVPLHLSFSLTSHAHAHGSLTYEYNIHRQNCLEDYGVKVAVEKLEKIDSSRLQDMHVSSDSVCIHKLGSISI